ncbi:MAG TPA: protein kinase, partial [Thermogutta sp.]|nr:protein kinase [Thermogutta sp.]
MDEVIRQVLEKQYGLKIGDRIGRGGFAEVYRAESASGVLCAIKVSLDPVNENNPAVKKELENLRLIQAVNGHPNIVSLMDYWVITGYLVTRWEFSAEGSLQDLLERYREEGYPGIAREKLFRYMADAAMGIDFLNRRGIYHRDIKPQNLLLFQGRVKLADLGLAKFAGASTASHTGSGTMGYLPPEAYDARRLSETVDLYSLAATYVKLRTGREPFGDYLLEVIERQKAGKPVLDGLEPDEVEAVRWALAPRPEDRPREGAVKWLRALYSRGGGRSVTAEVRPRSQFSELLVDPHGRGDVRTLAEALAKLQPGGVLRLTAGTHLVDQCLEVTQAATIVGEGMERTKVVCRAAGSILRLSGQGTLHVRGICFERLGASPGNVVDVTGGEVLFAECRFENGVYREGECWGAGLVLRGETHGIVRRCVFRRNQLGIVVTDQARPVLEENLCEGNTWSGISYYGNASGKAWKNTCRGNGLHGVYVSDQAQPELQENVCEQNGDSGIAYFRSASGKAWRNTCRGNKRYGVYAGERAQPALGGNFCEGNAKCGIVYLDNASGKAWKNTCRGNKLHGVRVGDQAQPVLEENLCEGNEECGMVYFDSAGG